ncbi:MAG: carboxypeptidase-like regulatory domain-containing protein [Acidobacteriota bacterium]
MNASLPRARLLSAVGLAILFSAGCASRPRPTAETLRRSRNPPAVVQGTVRDPEGRPVSGLSVQGLPREKDLAWSPAALTDEGGRFRLVLAAPGEYGFLVTSGEVTIVTPRSDDPSRKTVSLRAGEHRTGIALVFHREDGEKAILSPR